LDDTGGNELLLPNKLTADRKLSLSLSSSLRSVGNTEVKQTSNYVVTVKGLCPSFPQSERDALVNTITLTAKGTRMAPDYESNSESLTITFTTCDKASVDDIESRPQRTHKERYRYALEACPATAEDLDESMLSPDLQDPLESMVNSLFPEPRRVRKSGSGPQDSRPPKRSATEPTTEGTGVDTN
jgi:hypothetical protein